MSIKIPVFRAQLHKSAGFDLICPDFNVCFYSPAFQGDVYAPLCKAVSSYSISVSVFYICSILTLLKIQALLVSLVLSGMPTFYIAVTHSFHATCNCKLKIILNHFLDEKDLILATLLEHCTVLLNPYENLCMILGAGGLNSWPT